MDKTDETILSRPVRISDIPAAGLAVTFEATPAECAELAELLEVPAVKSLSTHYRLVRQGPLVHVTGTMKALVTQTCVVTLEPFDESVNEDIEVEFSEDADPIPDFDGMDEDELERTIAGIDLDAPEAIVDGRIDLGQLTYEILVIALDAHPRKPGVAFEPEDDEPSDSPFAALGALKTPRES
jgi:uncharacterized metal-binding protein YceD (DUF177 family)